jgi:Reverse transcriptase (RNA-dependent DNA polymerase)
MVVVRLYVDDMIYMGIDKELMSGFRDSMMRQFEMTDLYLLRYFLGLEVVQEK